MRLLAKVPDSFKSVTTLIFGNGFAAIFPILLAPVLTRIYSEEEFGIYTIFLAVVTIFSSFATGRYDLAILESKSKSVAKHLVILATGLSFIVSFFALILLKSLDYYFPELENLNRLDKLIYIIPVSILMVSLVQIINYILNREKKFNNMAGTKIVRTGFGSVFQVGGGYLKMSFYGLAIGKLAGDSLSFLYGLAILYRDKIFAGEAFHFKRIRYVAKKFEKYLKVNTLHSFLNVTTTSSIPLILGFFFEESIVGYYGLSFSVCFLPVTLISQAVFQIFSREVSIRIDEGQDALKYFKSTVLQLIAVSLPVFLILFLFGDVLFSFVFGDKWLKAGQFAQILSPYLFTSFVVSPFTFVALKMNKHEYTFKLELVSIILKISSITLGAYYFNASYSIGFFSLSGILINIYLLIWIYSLLKNQTFDASSGGEGAKLR